MSKWLFALIQFFPLSLFATYAFWHGAPSDDRWMVAVAGATLNRTRIASYWLILATLLALLAALSFRGNQTWAAVAPIVFLTVLQRILAHRLRCEGAPASVTIHGS